MNNKKTILFIGTYAASEYLNILVANKTYTQLAANQTQKYYLNGLSKHFDYVNVLSALSLPSYPRCPDLLIKPNVEHDDNIIVENVSFINLPIIRFISQFKSIYSLIKKSNQHDHFKSNVVIVYSMRLPYYFAARYIKKLNPDVKLINIVPDLPQYMHTEKKFSIKKLKSTLNQVLLLKLSSIFDGYVLYSKYMREILNCDEKNSIVIEGIISSNNHIKPSKVKNINTSKKIVLYAGGIIKEYGIENLVYGFIKSNIKNAELHLYGSGPYTQELSEICKDYTCIKYFGLVAPHEVKQRISEATLLVNPRPSHNEFTKYSCPSKTLEYMASGVPLLMTRLDGVPKEYYDYVYTIEDESIEGISTDLKKILNKSRSERLKKGCKAREFILSNKTEEVQTSKLLSFIDKL